MRRRRSPSSKISSFWRSALIAASLSASARHTTCAPTSPEKIGTRVVSEGQKQLLAGSPIGQELKSSRGGCQPGPRASQISRVEGSTSCKLRLFCQGLGVGTKQEEQARRPGEEREICHFWFGAAVYSRSKRRRPEPANRQEPLVAEMRRTSEVRAHIQSHTNTHICIFSEPSAPTEHADTISAAPARTQITRYGLAARSQSDATKVDSQMPSCGARTPYLLSSSCRSRMG